MKRVFETGRNPERCVVDWS